MTRRDAIKRPTKCAMLLLSSCGYITCPRRVGQGEGGEEERGAEAEEEEEDGTAAVSLQQHLSSIQSRVYSGKYEYYTLL